uniref:Flap endonuclease n=1 Tax=Pithovirus LCPAC401 TaxID=2506595 RepID=A0A481Z9E9_9VIRU|nr:MAG: flap endonuclease [Pithovirus LCPAC401]
MGIKGFGDLLKRFPHVKEEISTLYIGRTKIAIDAMIIMYKYYCISVKRSFDHMSVLDQEVDRDEIRQDFLIQSMMSINNLLKMKITPIFVFDGDRRVLKKETTIERVDKRVKAEDRSKELLREYKDRVNEDKLYHSETQHIKEDDKYRYKYQSVEQYDQAIKSREEAIKQKEEIIKQYDKQIGEEINREEAIKQKEEIIKQYDKQIGEALILYEDINKQEPLKPLTINEIQTYEDTIEKKLKQSTTIDKDDIKAFRELIESVGIPTVTARNDGEELCAALCRERKVFAAYTTDTDVLVFGSPVQLRSIKRSSIEITHLSSILEECEWSMEQFVDFCITLGCDFNKRMRQIGPARALILINKYKSIDNYPDKFGKWELNTDSLRYKECREIFRKKSSTELCLEGFTDKELSNLKIDHSKLKTSQAYDWVDTLKELYSNLGDPITTLVDHIEESDDDI